MSYLINEETLKIILITGYISTAFKKYPWRECTEQEKESYILEKLKNEKIKKLKNRKELKKQENITFILDQIKYIVKASETTITESNKKTNRLQYIKLNSQRPITDDISWVADGVKENGIVKMIAEPIEFDNIDYALCLFSCIDNYFQKIQNNYMKIKSIIQLCTTKEELDIVNLDSDWDLISNDCTPNI